MPINNYYGTIFDGSLDLETSVATQEILSAGDRWYNFTIIVDSNCHLSINVGNYME